MVREREKVGDPPASGMEVERATSGWRVNRSILKNLAGFRSPENIRGSMAEVDSRVGFPRASNMKVIYVRPDV